MRVISGKARGTRITSIESLNTRPTLDRVKESLFNILQERVQDSRVLDLFAGSGALGIEALSRGAQSAVFCDKNKNAITMVKQNLEKTKFLNKSKLLNMDYTIALKGLKSNKEEFDLIFIDPPYKLDISCDSIRMIMQYNLLSNGGIIVIETDEIDRDIQEINYLMTKTNIKIYDQRKYGRANLIFITK